MFANFRCSTIMMYLGTIFTMVILLVHQQIDAQPANQNQPILRGLTTLVSFLQGGNLVQSNAMNRFDPTQRPPYVEKDSQGKLRGYYVDLLDEMAAIGNFNYTLMDSTSTDNQNEGYGSRPTGLINEVYRQRADFAIADHLYRTINQQRYVDFSEPYLESNLSALIHKDRAAKHNIRTIEDLLEKQPKQISSGGQMTANDFNKQQQQQQQQQQQRQQQQQQPEETIALGTIRQIYRDLSVGTDPLSRRIYEQLHNNPANMVDNRQVGVERALNTPYAFIQESINNELAIDEHCVLTHIKVESPNYPMADTHFEYGIIGPKYSTNLEKFNGAIRELKANGRLAELKRKYWNRKCNSGLNSYEHYRYLLTVCTTMFSLFLSLFILS